MIVLRNTLAYILWLWELVRWPALSSGVFIFVFGAKFYRSCHIRRDKGSEIRICRLQRKNYLNQLTVIPKGVWRGSEDL